jgi:hypothetical protein
MIISGVDFFQSPCGRRAHAARKWFAEDGPPDLQPLPLGYGEREKLKDGSEKHILAHYARSLADQNYDVEKHPSFHDYACGWMASPVAQNLSAANSAELRKRFPPRPLDGLDSDLYWRPPEPVRSYRAAKRLHGGKVAGAARQQSITFDRV